MKRTSIISKSEELEIVHVADDQAAAEQLHAEINGLRKRKKLKQNVANSSGQKSASASTSTSEVITTVTTTTTSNSSSDKPVSLLFLQQRLALIKDSNPQILDAYESYAKASSKLQKSVSTVIDKIEAYHKGLISLDLCKKTFWSIIADFKESSGVDMDLAKFFNSKSPALYKEYDLATLRRRDADNVLNDTLRLLQDTVNKQIKALPKNITAAVGAPIANNSVDASKKIISQVFEKDLANASQNDIEKLLQDITDEYMKEIKLRLSEYKNSCERLEIFIYDLKTSISSYNTVLSIEHAASKNHFWRIFNRVFPNDNTDIKELFKVKCPELANKYDALCESISSSHQSLSKKLASTLDYRQVRTNGLNTPRLTNMQLDYSNTSNSIGPRRYSSLTL